MPIYEFRCCRCGRVFEALRSVDQGPDGLSCPDCGAGQLEQIWSTFAAGGSAGGDAAAGSCPSGGG